MFVLTMDQRGSRSRGDQVPDLLANLAGLLREAAGGAVVLPFERTVGDEVQGVLEDAATAVDVTLAVHRWGGWSTGIGAGPVDALGASARASSGPAFVAAREAVERARSRAAPVPLAVGGADPAAAGEAEAVLRLLAAVVRRRTAAGWAAIDATADRTQREAARILGISAQAVSQRLRAAMWEEDAAVRPVAARLLSRAGGLDPGTLDAGTRDPGTRDPGTLDAGTSDPGTLDPGTSDPGTLDAGTLDPGTLEPGTSDATPGAGSPGVGEGAA